MAALNRGLLMLPALVWVTGGTGNAPASANPMSPHAGKPAVNTYCGTQLVDMQEPSVPMWSEESATRTGILNAAGPLNAVQKAFENRAVTRQRISMEEAVRRAHAFADEIDRRLRQSAEAEAIIASAWDDED